MESLKITDYIYLAKKDLANFKLRSSLIILCIATGILSSTLNLYHSNKRSQELIASLTNLGSQLVSIQIQDPEISIKDILFLSSYFPVISYELYCYDAKIKYLGRDKSGSVIGTVPEYRLVHSLTIKKGRFISKGDIKEKRKVCAIESELSREVGIRIGEKLRIDETQLRVIGIFKEPEEAGGRIIIPYPIFKEVFAETTSSNKQLQAIILTEGKPEVLQKQVDKILKRRFPAHKKEAGAKKDEFRFDFTNARFFVQVSEGLLGMIKEQRFTSLLILLGIGLVTLILGGAGIVNLTLLSVKQRVREIGIMRTCGARGDDIFYLFLLEGFMLAIYGLCVGGGIAFVYVGLSEGLKFDVFIKSLVWSSIICLPVGCCSYYAASLASKISPWEAVRNG